MAVMFNSNKDIPAEYLLGNMLFYTLTDMTVDETTLLNLFDKNGLPKSFVRKISHADAFRRASSSIKNEDAYYTDANNNRFRGKINVDEVVNDKMYIKRIVGVRVLNDQKEEVFYKQIGSVTYDRANDCCASYLDPSIVNSFNGQDVTHYNNLLTQITTRYSVWATYHNHDTIRNTVNRIVDAMHPIALMPTGLCKFIPKVFNDILYGLEGLLDDLSDYSDRNVDKNVIEIIPFLDTQQQRDLVDKMYEKEITDSLYEYSHELSEILKNKALLTSRQAASYLERYKELNAKVSAYEGLLGSYKEGIREQLKIAIQTVQENAEA